MKSIALRLGIQFLIFSLLLNCNTLFWHIVWQDHHPKIPRKTDSWFHIWCEKSPQIQNLPIVTWSRTHLQNPASFPRLSMAKTINVMAPLMLSSFTQLFYSAKRLLWKHFTSKGQQDTWTGTFPERSRFGSTQASRACWSLNSFKVKTVQSRKRVNSGRWIKKERRRRKHIFWDWSRGSLEHWSFN